MINTVIENMQLQKQLSRKYKGKEYAKYMIVVSPPDIIKLGWKEGDELESEVKNGELVIKQKKILL
jgi:formylmethanofuran dehydrogenase subunit D